MTQDKKKALGNFRKILKCETVVGKDEEFNKFYKVLKESYPLVHSQCEYERIEDKSLLYRLKGRDENESVVLMSHYDVVPAEKGEWKYPPFSGFVGEGKIWGRGAIDTKCTLCGILEAVETLLSKGFQPNVDVYLCFGGDEETNGEGAKGIVSELKKRGISPNLVLDEGGAVFSGSLIGIENPIALIGIAEKGYMDVEFITKSKGGHTSMPQQKGNPMTTMAQVIMRIHGKPFPMQLTPPVKAMVGEVVKHLNPLYKTLLWNDRILKFFAKNVLIKGMPILGALFQTTSNITMIEGAHATNVVPECVRAIGNFRILNGNTVESTLKRLKSILSDLDVEVNILEGRDPSMVSCMDGRGWKILKSTITKTWGNTAIVPYVLLAASDSYFYQDISPYVYRFSPIRMKKEDKDAIHGINEGIRIKDFYRVIDFYVNLLGAL